MKDTSPKPKLNKKLTLHKETIRVLTDRELAEVEGGYGKPTYVGFTCIIKCPPPTYNCK
jgi:bacteriocin-like protein